MNLQSSPFCKGLYVLLKYDTMHPVFGKITDLVIINHTLIVCVIEYYGHTFSSHYNAFMIKSRGVVSAVNVHFLADHRSFPCKIHFCFIRYEFLYCITLIYSLSINVVYVIHINNYSRSRASLPGLSHLCILQHALA